MDEVIKFIFWSCIDGRDVGFVIKKRFYNYRIWPDLLNLDIAVIQ